MMTQSVLLKRSSVPWKPHAYMKTAIKFLLNHGAAALFLDPGLGKTSIVMAALKLLFKEGVSEGALVIAPLRVCYGVWPAEAEKWTDFEHLRVVVLHGKEREANFAAAADIYVINPEGLEWLVTGGRMEQLIKRGVDTLVVDELSKFKHPKTRRFKMLKPYLEKFSRRWGLTGSPASNGLLDLFGQCFILDLGNALGRYITHYRFKYFHQSGFGGYTWTPMPHAEDQIYEKLRPLVLRMEAGDYLDLPELITNNIRVDLPPAARKLYDEMEEHALAQLDEMQTVTAASAAAAMIKCSQIANGGIYLDPVYNPDREFQEAVKREWKVVHGAKVEALQDLAEELQGAPLLVAYEFRHDLERILAALGPKTPWIGGGVPAKRAAQIQQDWNDEKLPVLLGHPASMGHGLNLQGKGNIANVCWFGITFDYDLYLQMIARVLRQGNTAKHVIVHRIIARDTVDEARAGAITRKGKVQNALLEALKDYRKGVRL